MRRYILVVHLLLALATLPASAQSEPALTIYNQDFAVVRQPIELRLAEGINEILFTGTTAQLEPSSVILRDPSGQWDLGILEQSYRADPVSQSLLLSLFEGQTIDFLVGSQANPQIVRGRIVRSGYLPAPPAYNPYNPYQNYAAQAAGQPIIEVAGQLRFGLPGLPLFPNLADDTILKPTLNWMIRSGRGGTVDAELGYVTGGFSWQADYNIVAEEEGDDLDLLGWVTVRNSSGKSFPEARLKLLAGEVRKLNPQQRNELYAQRAMDASVAEAAQGFIEKAFDEYHLYTLQRKTALRDQETKQIEFLRSPKVASKRVYVYDGVYLDPRRYGHYSPVNRRQDTEYGIEYNSKIWVVREFDNSEANGLGVPLPRGRMRFYRRDADGQLEFTGENQIDHTPQGEKIRVHTGNAFDLVGKRLRTDYQVDSRGHWIDESFEIELRNRKEDEAVEIRVVEHLYRWSNWEIVSSSVPFRKVDSQTIEFLVNVAPGAEEVLTYKVHYSW